MIKCEFQMYGLTLVCVADYVDGGRVVVVVVVAVMVYMKVLKQYIWVMRGIFCGRGISGDSVSWHTQ